MSSFGVAGTGTEIDKALNQLQRFDATESQEDMSKKLDKLISLIEEIHVANREKTATLVQMIFTLEDNLNKRIDDTRKEIFEKLQLDQSNGNVPTSLHAILDKNSDMNLSNSNYKGAISTATITPQPGFVIKTKKLLGCQEKAFINVFHHPKVELEPIHLPRGHANDKPYIIIGSILSTDDKKGGFCYVYNIVVSTEYFQQSEIGKDTGLRIASPDSVRKIIHKVNLKYDDFLDESNYSLPRLSTGYKGSDIHPVNIPVCGSPDETKEQASKRLSFYNRRRGSMEAIKEDDNASVVSDMTCHSQDLTSTGDRSLESSPFSSSSLEHTPERRASDTARRSSLGSLSAIVGGSGGNSGGKKEKRKSFVDTKSMAMHGGNILGRNLLHGDMCEYVPEETISKADAHALKLDSITHPTVLLGWQVKIDGKTDLYVVTDVRKNFMQKSEFRLSRFKHDDKWELLKRAEGKSGTDFLPMRKVLFGLEDEEDDADLTSLASSYKHSMGT